MNIRHGIGYIRRLRARRLLEASQAMLVWNLRHGSGDRPKSLKG